MSIISEKGGIYKCQLCHESHLSKKYLISHMKDVHTRKFKNYPCMIPGCKRGCSWKNDLKHHTLYYHDVIGF
jgi:hypothetical protein